ncbi:hypothetical protein, partial [Leptospira alstonii]|uniref:hypothetical protein n=1 Tax=Leptospira alstonii TaxID=28452 RepID=UPI000586C520
HHSWILENINIERWAWENIQENKRSKKRKFTKRFPVSRRQRKRASVVSSEQRRTEKEQKQTERCRNVPE